MRLKSRLSRLFTALLVLTTMVSGASYTAAQSQSSNFTAKGLTADNSVSNDPSDGKPEVVSTVSSTGMTSVFIKLNSPSLAEHLGDNFSLNSPEAIAYLSQLRAELDQLEGRVKAKLGTAVVTHRFDIILGGLSVLVPADQLDALKGIPNVEQIMLDRVEKLQTDRSNSFIGATNMWRRLGGQSSAGEGVIVGVLDSGIWPEHPSFSDPDPSGKPFAAPPATASGAPRSCVFGQPNPLGNDAPFTCNNKLIGAYRFMSTYTAFIPLEAGEFRSARDDDGHGSHTASTAAGNGKVAATIFGVSRGIISGVAPRAHVVAYKVCGIQGCFGTDSAAAVQQAIRDRVNVINFSISGGSNPYADVVSLAFRDAYQAGVFVAASAGNSGPGADTTDHREPWVTTVAASTTDRAFKNTLTLTGNGGATLVLKGTSVTGGTSAPAEVVVPTDVFCNAAFPAGSVAGKVVVCQRGGGTGRVQKGFNVLQGGAAGMILYNSAPNVTDQQTDNHFLPTTQIQFSEGQQVLAFVAANAGATASLTSGLLDTQQGDVMASFSSRGGPGQSLGISKPDITAPGVQILAAHTPASVDIATGPQGQLFQSIAGTSMSSPHIAGSAALMKALHPTWSPGQIKSAMMMTAKTRGLVKEDGVTPFTPFDAGSGRIDLRKAGSPALTISASTQDFITYRNELWKANYPSIYVPVMPGVITVSRTVQSVRDEETEWDTRVKSPADVDISVTKHFQWKPAGAILSALRLMPVMCHLAKYAMQRLC
jgi:subtilisin family serine protease